MQEMTYDLKPARKTFSRVGLAMTVILVITSVLQSLWFVLPDAIWGEGNWMTGSSWGMWLGTFIPIYLIAIPVGLLIMRPLPAEAPQDHKLKVSEFLLLLPMCYCLTYAGNLIGTFLSVVLSGGTAENAITEYAMDTNPLKILVMVILAPLLEEYVCRRQIIDRTRKYGEKTAAILSAIAFGLLHQNLFQFFYAFALGLVFSYIYLRTGRLRYTVLLHGIINFMGSVIAPWILSIADLEALNTLDLDAPAEILLPALGQILPGLLVYLLYATLLWGLSVAGLVLLILKRKQIVWQESPEQLPKGTAVKTVYFNVGMVVYVLLCLASIVLTLV